MLLTLAAGSLKTLLSAPGSDGLTLFDVPALAIRQLELRGLNIPASMLSGWSVTDLDKLRDRADKAGCPCLVLFEDAPLKVASQRAAVREKTLDRIQRLAIAANRLGCSAVAVRISGSDDDETFERAATELKAAMPAVERFELNLLIAPFEGLTLGPDRLTDLIKRIGGFRIGSLPDFAHAAMSGDLIQALRKLAPYAGAVHATVNGFDAKGRHSGYDLAECVAAIRSVGFVNTLAIDFIGDGDPIENLDRARVILQEAIDDA